LAFIRGDANEFAPKVALLEGELAGARLTRDMAKVNFQGLFDRVPDINRWWEDAERQCLDLVLENFGTRICDLILRPPSDRVCLSDRLEEVVRRLQVEQV
jgi:hypothetical protein